MKGDYTRDTFRPDQNFEDVRLQQGRVHLDSDWNERGDIHRFLRETSLTDVIGDSGVPVDAEESFEVFIDGGCLKVRPGRIWVEGILCRADEVIDVGPVPASGNHVIYLEVWRRLVTAVEDPYIREVALGGPDTAVREQVVCRPRVAALAGDEHCADLEDWRPDGETDGTLVAQAVPPASGDDPCPVPAQAGYTGLENHLYRVQIHDSGTTGTGSVPTFKWSRDNGAILTEWLDRDDRVLKVGSLGRDRVGGFHDARWVELGHDGLDLTGEPGPLVELEGSPVGADGGGVLTVTAGSAGALFDPPTAQHAKVRRWDSGPVEITPDTPMTLESHIEVQFSAGTYRTGDYWLIPARAFVGEHLGSIEWPEDGGAPAALPPRGVDRRYCKLAVLWFDAGIPTFDDCRRTFPPLTDLGVGCCTVVVEPGQNIQAAIDSLPDAGGCVCLKTGLHEVREAVRIDRSRVVLHGESPGVVVSRATGPLLLEIGTGRVTVEDVVVQSIDFRFSGDGGDDSSMPLLANVQRGERCLIEECRFSGDGTALLFGIRIAASREITIQRCGVVDVVSAIWVDTDSMRLAIRDNLLRGIQSEERFPGIAVNLEDAYGPSWIEGNRITGFLQGIVLNRNGPEDRPDSQAAGSVIRRNVVEAEGPEGSGDAVKLFLIDVAASSCTVAENSVRYDSALYGGIRVVGPRGRVEDNLLDCSMSELPDENPALGVMLGYSSEEPGVFGRHGMVSGNRFSGAQDGIRLEGVTGARIANNVIEGQDSTPRTGIALAACTGCHVTGNRLGGFVNGIVLTGGEKNRALDNDLETGGTGISASSETALMVARNRMDNIGQWGFGAYNLLGTVTVQANRVLNCGHTPSLLGARGIVVIMQIGELQIESCEVMNTGVSPDGKTVMQPAIGIDVLLVLECRIQGNLVTYSITDGRKLSEEDRALRAWGLLEFSVNDVVFGFCAQVVDNKFVGTGRTALVEFLSWPHSDLVFSRFERVAFNDNYCAHVSEEQREAATVLLRGRSGIAVGNHIKSMGSRWSVRFDNMRGIFLGNDTDKGANIDFPSPESSFNHS